MKNPTSLKQILQQPDLVPTAVNTKYLQKQILTLKLTKPRVILVIISKTFHSHGDHKDHKDHKDHNSRTEKKPNENS